mmetsp:Transcript_2078/g.6733  ORF Transcript_2078/g.6733 Transcript_2078/m.6733 type:complete len:96 (-) Transcript_2078:1684-1971(-)
MTCLSLKSRTGRDELLEALTGDKSGADPRKRNRKLNVASEEGAWQRLPRRRRSASAIAIESSMRLETPLLHPSTTTAIHLSPARKMSMPTQRMSS